MSTTYASVVPAQAPLARRTGPSFPTLTGLEIRKSLSTRSGKAVASLAVAVGPLGVLLATMTSGGGVVAAVALGIMGMLIALVLLALGVLSTAGEWTHKSVQTTYLLVPQRGRVLAAKAVAAGLMGAVFTAVAAALAAGVLAVAMGDLSWAGTGQAGLAVAGAGAAFAVIGAGAGAAMANTPAALTTLYLLILGVMPVLRNVRPEIAEKVDPTGAVLNLAQGVEQTTSIAILSGWVVASVVVGAISTHRRPVQ